ncbi:MAG: polysaccharide biosynthesis protein [Clostridia bacterium]|nr:polysaccharide biosynthesis protein [Clostridia bacterium]
MKGKKNFVAGAGVLAGAVVFAKVLGAAYRIPLANILGAEGMGLYQFVYPVFALLLTLSSGAVPSAVSITVSGYLTNGDRAGAKHAFDVILRLCLFIGIAGTAILLVLAYPVSLLQHEDAFIGYLTVAPAVLIVTLISAFRGWYFGHKDTVPSSISQITEGLVKLAVGLVLAEALLPYGKRFAVAGALFGVVASEAVTLLIMAIVFKVKDKEGFVRVRLRENKEVVRSVGKVIAPLILCGLILPASQFLDSVLVVNLLKVGGTGQEEATALYGVFSGVVTPLVNLPVMVCISLGVAVTPQMVEGRERRDVDFVMDKCTVSTKLTLLLGIPFLLVYLLLAERVVGFLFPSIGEEKLATATLLLRISAPGVLGLSIFQIYSAMFQGLGRARTPVRIMASCAGIKLLLELVLTPTIGIVGTAVGCAVGYTLSGVLIMIRFFTFVRKMENSLKNGSAIALCGVIMAFVVFMGERLATGPVGLLVVGAFSAFVYVSAVFTLRIFSREELAAMPFSERLLLLDDKLRK